MGTTQAHRIGFDPFEPKTGLRARVCIPGFFQASVRTDTTEDDAETAIDDPAVALAPEPEPKKKAKKPKGPPKFWRDIAAYQAVNEGELLPGPASPICKACGLNEDGKARTPYTEARGSTDPLITVVFESISLKEDDADELGVMGCRNGNVKKNLEKLARGVGIDPLRIRYTSLTRCANRCGKPIAMKTRGQWCRAHLIRDLQQYPPQVIIPVGTTVLGRLSHKSSAQDWAGRILTYRGWPDDWITESKYDQGSPFTGAPPDKAGRVLILPIQAPHIVSSTQNPRDMERWFSHMVRALELARDGAAAMSYSRPWFHIATTRDDVIARLKAIPSGVRVAYDLETMGLLPFGPGAAIVFAMFRWKDPDGMPRALGFPWKYEERRSPEGVLEAEGSPFTAEDRDAIAPHWCEVLYRCRIVGHNVSFDLNYTFAQLQGINLEQMTDGLDGDTRYMLYALRQSRENRGLEQVAYDWCPSMAGYEEEFELLKRRMPEILDPASGKGGHYANVPKALWPDVLVPYVMGDVEVCYEMAEGLDERLKKAKVYRIPLADPDRPGEFRLFQPVGRYFMYRRFMLPAQRVLTRMMSRGLYVDADELLSQEDMFPKLIRAAREDLRKMDPRVVAWCQHNEATEKDWTLDLESRDQLRTILFEILQLPVKRLTDSGEAYFEGKDFADLTREEQIKYAAIDKFTLNALVAENPALKPLQEYRKLYKGYTAFVRSLRNITTEGIDKHARKKDPYLQMDGCVHTTFNQAGTGSGRLASRNPNLQQLPGDSIIKRMYGSRFGFTDGCIYQADLSQIELRLLAAACGDPLMVKAYRDDLDLHSLTTSKIFKVPYEHFEKSHMQWLQKEGRDKEAKELELKRKIGKTTNFLTAYLGGAYGLMTTLAESQVYLTEERCQEIVDSLFDTYPGLRKHIALYKRFILNNAVAVSITGRVRVLEEVYSEDKGIVNKALRSGFNHLIQSTASDIMLTCMSVIEFLMRDHGLRSILVSTVHDSIVVDAVRSELPIVHDICHSVINNIPEVMHQMMGPEYDLSWMTVVPLAGDCECGPNYGDQRKVAGDPITGKVDWDAIFAPKKSK